MSVNQSGVFTEKVMLFGDFKEIIYFCKYV